MSKTTKQPVVFAVSGRQYRIKISRRIQSKCVAVYSSYLGLPLLSMIFLLFSWFSYENKKIKRERKKYDCLHSEEAEAERKKLEYLKIKWAKEEKKANEIGYRETVRGT